MPAPASMFWSTVILYDSRTITEPVDPERGFWISAILYYSKTLNRGLELYKIIMGYQK